MRAAQIKLETAPLCLLKAVALGLAREIDAGKKELRDELERVMSYIPNAKVP